MPLNVMLNPKKSGANAYFEPISGLHVTLSKRQGSINEMNPHIFNALKNGTLVPLNFRVKIDTQEIEMIGVSKPAPPIIAPPIDSGAGINTQISRPGPGIARQTVIEKPKELTAPAYPPPAADNTRIEEDAEPETDEKAMRKANRGRPKINKEQ